MGKLIPFPKPKIKLTTEETLEYQEIKQEIEEIKGLRDLYYCKRRVKDFLQKVKGRSEGNM
ncbi:hypothetical protein [Ferdinandcohnia sp. Marseille-Q9671]